METVITYHAISVWALSLSLAATKEIEISLFSYRY